VGEVSCNDEGCSDTGQTDAIGSCAEKDRCGTEGAMGEGEVGEEIGLIFFPRKMEVVGAIEFESKPKRSFKQIQRSG
jgi:hypothetical protein